MIHAREMLEHLVTSLGAAGGRRSQGGVSAAVGKMQACIVRRSSCRAPQTGITLERGIERDA